MPCYFAWGPDASTKDKQHTILETIELSDDPYIEFQCCWKTLLLFRLSSADGWVGNATSLSAKGKWRRVQLRGLQALVVSSHRVKLEICLLCRSCQKILNFWNKMRKRPLWMMYFVFVEFRNTHRCSYALVSILSFSPKEQLDDINRLLAETKQADTQVPWLHLDEGFGQNRESRSFSRCPRPPCL